MSNLAVARRKLISLRELGWRDRLLVVEAALLLGAARLTLRLVPWRWYKRWLTLDRSGAAWDPLLVSRVRRAVGSASRNLPIDAACLPQAMAAKAMLARRGTGTKLVIGAGQVDDGTMILHAWLEAGGTVVTGGAGRSSVTPVVTFGEPRS